MNHFEWEHCSVNIYFCHSLKPHPQNLPIFPNISTCLYTVCSSPVPSLPFQLSVACSTGKRTASDGKLEGKAGNEVTYVLWQLCTSLHIPVCMAIYTVSQNYWCVCLCLDGCDVMPSFSARTLPVQVNCIFDSWPHPTKDSHEPA